MLNFKDVFSNTCPKAAIAVLEEYTTPALIVNADKNKLISLIQNSSRKSLEWATATTAKCELLILKAREFEPLGIYNPANVAMLGIYISICKCQSKPKKVVLGAFMRELVCVIFAVLRDRKPYQLRTPEEHAKMLEAKRTVA